MLGNSHAMAAISNQIEIIMEIESARSDEFPDTGLLVAVYVSLHRRDMDGDYQGLVSQSNELVMRWRAGVIFTAEWLC